jgi:TldD protein
LTDAVERLARSRDDPLIFLERRDDLRVELGSGRVECATETETRSEGIAVEFGTDPVRHLYLSDPGPADLEAIAEGRIPDERAPADPELAGNRSPSPAPPPVRDRLDALLGAMGATGEDCSVDGRLVTFTQTVVVARPDRGAVVDSRRGERVRIDVRVRRGGRVGAATAEWVDRRGRSVLDAERLVGFALERARERCDARPPTGGPCAAVFAPGVGGVLVHELVGHALEGDTVLRNGCRLGAADLSFASRDVTVIDDPRRGRASWSVDDEGETVRPVALIRDGHVVGRLHDRRTARRAGTAPTGHGRRSSYLEPALPRMGCTFVGRGGSDPTEVLRATPDGIYVRRMEAASVEPFRGAATFRVTDADRIRDGRLDHPLEPFVLEATLEATLTTLDHIGTDLAFDACVGSCLRDGQPLATSVGAPTFRLGVVTVHT